ncbi:McrC family protein [Streptomyces scabiei]|uniref:McrC family protein n=1 Tax=Streptomyces scabiei TaxID=1930 RepID=UPI000A91F5FA|nr:MULTISPECIES: McrC family protein [Streptomyces]MDW8477042.1 McrC family protein [Streptomyces scabiei]MDX2568628.1 McrC family protein [Streptomyces scabiei]MDX2629742.1 McrC family protein [Streptomyces scabiei]MDX2689852.1 McrC family protein [Streptomyces scabiei]MDX2755681.1 McrC family protein [Streptomyces scabiei]
MTAVPARRVRAADPPRFGVLGRIEQPDHGARQPPCPLRPVAGLLHERPSPVDPRQMVRPADVTSCSLPALPGHDTAHRTLLPVDAKYKRYDRHGVSAADVHQLLTYSSGYASAAAPTAVIVHPRTGGHARRTLHVRGPNGLLGTIVVLGVDTRSTPEQATAWIGSVLR